MYIHGLSRLIIVVGLVATVISWFAPSSHLTAAEMSPAILPVRATLTTKSDSINRFNLFAAEAYLLYGPWGKYLSSNLKAIAWPDKSDDTEGYLRFEGNIKRIALYGSYPVSRRLTLYSGVMRGSDDLALGGRFRSLGAYVEATTPVINDLTHAGVRYDWFDPARNKANNEVNGVTVFINVWYREMFCSVGEHRHLDVKQGPVTTRKDHAFQVRLIFIK